MTKQQICQKEEETGHKVLAPLAGMFISNINDDIKIEFNAVETGWKIKGSKVKVCGNIMFQLKRHHQKIIELKKFVGCVPRKSS